MTDHGREELCPARARASAELIPQPHGGAIRPPWTPGNGAAAGRSSIRAIRKESLHLLAEATPEATCRLIELMRSSDERVAAVAATAIMDRVHGKATSKPPVDEETREPLDFSKLSDAELEEAHGAYETLIRLSRPR